MLRSGKLWIWLLGPSRWAPDCNEKSETAQEIPANGRIVFGVSAQGYQLAPVAPVGAYCDWNPPAATLPGRCSANVTKKSACPQK